MPSLDARSQAWRRAHPLLGLGFIGGAEAAKGGQRGDGRLLTLRGGGLAGAVRGATVVEAVAALTNSEGEQQFPESHTFLSFTFWRGFQGGWKEGGR